ncbi:DEAD/DEAH box helicase [Pontibacterium sp. N1Y112]|uniref:DEAD/DEAH box helicase n=1 Tax=Pontibacterium sinense TaxID=2781979 RepID=A0A8J7FB83_9GAMM|nr:DEAD/DEAH box helicase [Pontibacterium sinense]MBE9397772.1 DEAD/DEAH box helicase [Pontibacterium sinense]
MLKEILSNFSEDELLSFLPKEAVEFALCVSDTDDEGAFNKEQLAEIVANTKKVDFVFNGKLRNLLIDRLKTSIFIDIFPEFKLVENEVKPIHYQAAISWADENIQEFSKKIELESIYKSETSLNTSVESISSIEPAYPLYPYQQAISKNVLASLQNKERILIHLPTGAGKTRTAMNIVSEHLRESENNVVLWLADREELCTQAFSEFKKAWSCLGNRSSTIYGIYSTSDESLSGIDSGFVVGGLHKLLSIKKNDSNKLKLLYRELCRSVTLVVFDEAHKAIAPKFKEVINDFVDREDFSAKLLGLTATPGRVYSDEPIFSEEDRQLSDFFYKNKVSMEMPGYISPIDYLVENGYLAKANFKSLNYDGSGISAYELRDSGGAETVTALAGNKERNKRIINKTLDECERGSQIIIFACTVQHSINLAIALACEGIKAASIDSKNDSPESRRAKIEQYKKCEIQVLVNFNVLTAGFDAPKTNVTIIAKPMNSLVQYLQMAGRAMRGIKSGGNRECNIYTVMDEIPEFQSINIAFEYWNNMWSVSEKD